MWKLGKFDMSELNESAPNDPVTSAAAQMQEAESRRSTEREVVSYLGIASYGDGDLTQVSLVDLSALGARMVAPAGFEPEKEFVLKVPETGACFLSEVAWRNEKTFGVRFLRPFSG